MDDLFDYTPSIKVADLVMGRRPPINKCERQWLEFHQKNPRVYGLFDRFARMMLDRGYKNGSAGADIREVYAEAKGTGFDTKAMRAVIRLRKMDADARSEMEALVHLYKDALGIG